MVTNLAYEGSYGNIFLCLPVHSLPVPSPLPPPSNPEESELKGSIYQGSLAHHFSSPLLSLLSACG